MSTCAFIYFEYENSILEFAVPIIFLIKCCC